MKNGKLVLLVFLVVAFIGYTIFAVQRDKNEELLARTQPIPLGNGIELVEMKKHGTIYHRTSYEAKISIPHSDPEAVVAYLSEMYGFEGQFMAYSDYVVFSDQIFSGTSFTRPKVEQGTTVWVQGVGEDRGANVVNIIVSEDASHAYLYVYYHA